MLPNVKRLAATTTAALMLFISPAFAADDETLPYQIVIGAIQPAVSASPGRIKEMEVDRNDGWMSVEVEILGNDEKEKEVQVTRKKNAFLRSSKA